MEHMLSKTQKEVLVGLLLGDGSLEFDGCKGTRLQVKQSVEKKEYVLWLYEQFRDMVRTPPQQRVDTKQWYFGTRYRNDLEDMRKLFYRDRVKIVPLEITTLLSSSLTLAVWFMDDGRLDYRAKSHYAFRLSTDAFTMQEVMRLQEVLMKRFDISSHLHMSLCRGKRYPQIYIGKEGRYSFYKAVSPHILSCFAYKLPPSSLYLDPSETTRRAPLNLN